ncbi:MAG: quaternary ammonium compound-resistance protein, partial [Rhodospirillales bacterium]|nr:quaternary ammonium compound-resistance protein [Rhodospirillales bacterium]
MAWTILVLAGFLEVGWAVGLKYADGFTRVVPSVLTIASMIASIVLLGVAMKSIPLGTAYAVWTGIGTVGALIAGMILFGDS